MGVGPVLSWVGHDWFLIQAGLKLSETFHGIGGQLASFPDFSGEGSEL